MRLYGTLTTFVKHTRGFISRAREILEYAATMWYPYTQHDISRLEKVQRNAVIYTWVCYE